MEFDAQSHDESITKQSNKQDRNQFINRGFTCIIVANCIARLVIGIRTWRLRAIFSMLLCSTLITEYSGQQTFLHACQRCKPVNIIFELASVIDVYLGPAHWKVYTITLDMYNIVMCIAIA